MFKYRIPAVPTFDSDELDYSNKEDTEHCCCGCLFLILIIAAVIIILAVIVLTSADVRLMSGSTPGSP